MNTQRIIGATTIGVTGLGLLFIAVRQLLLGIPTLIGVLIAVTTLVLGVAFTMVGPIAYRTDIESQHLLRIAGWNTLGVIATSVVVWLIASFQTSSGGRLTAPLLSGGLIVGVSAFAHVLIGFNDVRRIRAQTVAKQRQKAAVVNRIVRHDLKHTAQLLIGYGNQVDSGEESSTSTGTSLGEKIRTLGSELSKTHDQIKTIDALIEQEEPRHPVDVYTAITRNESRWGEAYPDATFEVDLPQDFTVLAGKHLETALTELIENAFEHGGNSPTVAVRGTYLDGRAQVAILDTGDGFPDHEQALINTDQTESQLEHSSGLGLWLAKWIVEQYDGTLSLDSNPESTGSKVVIDLPATDQ